MQDNEYFRSSAGIKKYLIKTYNFALGAIDVVRASKFDTYLYLAEGDKLYKYRLCGQPTYTTKSTIDSVIKKFYSTERFPVQ